jgi:hypothetical protein
MPIEVQVDWDSAESDSDTTPLSTKLCRRCGADFFVIPPPSCVPGLRQNYVTDAATSLVEAQEDLARCNEELELAEALGANLRSIRLCLNRRIEEQSSLRAPIRRIPVEVLCEIFAWYCLPIYELRYPDDLFDKEAIEVRPFTLAAVCTFWRHVALNQSSLWSCLMLLHPPKNSSAFRGSPRVSSPCNW